MEAITIKNHVGISHLNHPKALNPKIQKTLKIVNRKIYSNLDTKPLYLLHRKKVVYYIQNSFVCFRLNSCTRSIEKKSYDCCNFVYPLQLYPPIVNLFKYCHFVHLCVMV